MRKITNEQFNEKYALYKNMIYSITYTYVHNVTDADDITQDVFIKYLNSDEVFQTLDNEKFWLIRVTINTCKSYLKKYWKKNVYLDDDYINRLPSDRENSNDKTNDDIFEYVFTLPQKYKTVIILFYYENLSINDISKTLKITESNVKKRLERARNILREKVNKSG